MMQWSSWYVGLQKQVLLFRGNVLIGDFSWWCGLAQRQNFLTRGSRRSWSLSLWPQSPAGRCSWWAATGRSRSSPASTWRQMGSSRSPAWSGRPWIPGQMSTRGFRQSRSWCRRAVCLEQEEREKLWGQRMEMPAWRKEESVREREITVNVGKRQDLMINGDRWRVTKISYRGIEREIGKDGRGEGGWRVCLGKNQKIGGDIGMWKGKTERQEMTRRVRGRKWKEEGNEGLGEAFPLFASLFLTNLYICLSFSPSVKVSTQSLAVMCLRRRSWMHPSASLYLRRRRAEGGGRKAEC